MKRLNRERKLQGIAFARSGKSKDGNNDREGSDDDDPHQEKKHDTGSMSHHHRSSNQCIGFLYSDAPILASRLFSGAIKNNASIL